MSKKKRKSQVVKKETAVEKNLKLMLSCSGAECEEKIQWVFWGKAAWINVGICRPGSSVAITEEEAMAKWEQYYFCSEECFDSRWK